METGNKKGEDLFFLASIFSAEVKEMPINKGMNKYTPSD